MCECVINESQTLKEVRAKNVFHYMGEVAPASAMLILPTEGLSISTIENSKWSNHRL